MLTAAAPTVDALEAELTDLEALIARARARQADLLHRLETAAVAAMDGARSMVEWTAARLDVTHSTARRLLQASRQLPEHPAIDAQIEAGEMTFDRAVETLRLAAAGASPAAVEGSAGLDLDGVRRLTARHRRMTAADERHVFSDRHLATQVSLDGSAGRFWGELPAFEFRIFEKAVDTRADQFRDLPGPASPASARRADALVSLAQDSLDPTTDPLDPADTGTPADPLVTVFVDAATAGPSGGEAGVEIEFGPKAGPATLERLQCLGAVQVVALRRGRPVATTDATRPIPPAVRRFVAWRDGGCTIAGCRSRYRLQPHHIRPRSQGGSHDPDNLTTLCWYHHHVVIHGRGFRLDPESPPGRRRFLRPAPGPDPP